MRRGYIKLWRKSFDSGLMSNPGLWLFWTWCLLKASHKKKTQLVGYQNVELKPGQFVFGRRKAASTLNLSENVVRRCLKSLIIADRITIKRTNKFSIITIVNWDTYQSDDSKGNQQNAQQGTTERTNNEPTTGQQEATNKNVKNVKNIYTSDFEEFWKHYPKKVGKGAAYKSWKKIKEPKTTLSKIQTALIWQKESDQWAKDNGQFIPHPATYLNQRRWEDEKPSEQHRRIIKDL